MKKLNVTFILMFLALLGNAETVSAARSDVNTPEAVIQELYKWYIVAVDGGTDPMKSARTTLKKYVTLRLINEIVRDDAKGLLEADSFVQTQEWDKEWANHVTVSKLNVKATTATAFVTFGSPDYPRVAVTLVKAAGIWKIDRVKIAIRNYSH